MFVKSSFVSLPLYCLQREACEFITFTLSQKAKKKQVEEQISQLSAKLKEKHVEELASLGYNMSTEMRKATLII